VLGQLRVVPPREGEQVEAGERRPVALGRTAEAEALVDAVRRAHRRLAGAHDAGLPPPAGLLDDVREQRGADAAALAGGVDREHPELRLVRLGDLAERAAVRDERDRPEQRPTVHRDEHLGRGRPPRHVAQHGGVPVGRIHERGVRGDAEVGDDREFGRRGGSDDERHGSPHATGCDAASTAPPTIARVPGRAKTPRPPPGSFPLMAARFPFLAAAAAALLVPAAAAHAAPPANDLPTAAAPFAPYTAANGTPFERQALADLAEATPDPALLRCLGDDSFERTVWFSVPATSVASELTVDASGRTLAPIDLAAFVQPEIVAVPVPPATGAQATVNHTVPNACAGLGDGGASSAEEPGNAVSVRVPPNHPVLIQVGRRGMPGVPADEGAVLSLRVTPIATFTPALGDRADPLTPVAQARRPTLLALTTATITAEDPATPPCPSLGTVWRRLLPGDSEPRRITVTGRDVATLAAFTGEMPAEGRALDCVVRDERGPLEMIVPVRRGRTTWLRVGTDSLAGAPATLAVARAGDARVIDGGRGGVDPTPGGPGGGLPAACDRPEIERARIAGPRLSGPPGRYNVDDVPIVVNLRGARVCDAELRLYGPHGFVYAKAVLPQLKAGKRTVLLGRRRTFARGRYRLELTGIDRLGDRVKVRGNVQGTLR
jgi:hypothetical protein